MTDDALNIVAGFPANRVLVVGDVILDEYIVGETRRISPESPVPVVELRETVHALGGAANVAANITSLGGRVLLSGIVGEDAPAVIIREQLSKLEIGTGLFVDLNRPTTVKTRIIAHGQHVVRIDHEDRKPISLEMEENILKWIETQLGNIDIIVLSDYAKGTITSAVAKKITHMGGRTGKPIVVNPKGRDYGKYRGATVLVPNILEARHALDDVLNAPEELQEIGQALLASFGGSAVLITRGPDGMDLFQVNHKNLHIPTMARQVFDVTGAGDTVVATLALALAHEATLEEAASLANVAAGIAVGKVGTVAVTRNELMEVLRT